MSLIIEGIEKSIDYTFAICKAYQYNIAHNISF